MIASVPDRDGRAAPGPWRADGPLLLLLAGLLGALAALAFTATSEFGPWRDYYMQGDEALFAACAKRGLAIGQGLNLGCHDNKAPLIYIVYQALGWIEPELAPLTIKLVAFCVVLLLTAQVAVCAWQAGGGVAALVAAVLALCCLAPNCRLLALKTETLGMVPVLGVLMLLGRAAPPRRAWTLLAAGLLLAQAMLTKQTYALLVLLVVPLWLERRRQRSGLGAWQATLGDLALLALPMVVLVLAFAGWAWSAQRLDEFAASGLLYPSVYGQGPPRTPYRIALRLSDIVATGLDPQPLLVLLSVVGAAALVRAGRGAGPQVLARQCGLAAVVVLFGLAVAAPSFWAYHCIPFWLAMCPLAAAVAAQAWRDRQQPALRWVVAWAVVLTSISSLNQAWSGNGGRSAPTPGSERIDAATGALRGVGRYGYVLGFPWPEFYANNNLIPASDVMYPWALPDSSKSWAYTPPPADSGKARWLAAQQSRNLAALYRDFARTPPAVIGLLQEPDQAPLPPGRWTSQPGFDDYLRQHCRYERAIADPRGKRLQIFRCS